MQDTHKNRLVEVEIAETRLRTYRAERRILENERVSRLKSLLASPCPQEPAELTFDLSLEESQKVCNSCV